MPSGTLTADATIESIRDLDRGQVPCLVHALARKGIVVNSQLSFALPDNQSVEVGRGATDNFVSSASGKRLELADRTVSKHQASLRLELVEEKPVLVVTDPGSRNGTFVNGERISEAAAVDGDWVGIGSHVFVFRLAPLRWLGFLRKAANPEQAFLGQGVAVYLLMEQISRIAATQIPVIVEGETGTGKEVLAREIHRLSGRPGPFVGINCGAIPENLFESELFGHARGAFSGADKSKVGLVTSADGGTLLLDEIGDMPASAQVKLLRVLQEGEVLPLGETRPQRVDVRVIAATHRGLEALSQAGRFRSDLYARLRGLALHVPPLAKRLEDIGILFAEGLRRAGTDPSQLTLTSNAASALLACPWPHNTRQLLQVAAVAAALAEDSVIEREHLSSVMNESEVDPSGEGGNSEAPAEAPGAHSDAIAQVVLTARHRKQEPEPFREALGALMKQENGNVTRVAALTGFSRMQVYRWLKEIGWTST